MDPCHSKNNPTYLFKHTSHLSLYLSPIIQGFYWSLVLLNMATTSHFLQKKWFIENNRLVKIMPKSSFVEMLSINTKKCLYIYDFKLVFDKVLHKGAPLPPNTHTYTNTYQHTHTHTHTHTHNFGINFKGESWRKLKLQRDLNLRGNLK